MLALWKKELRYLTPLLFLLLFLAAGDLLISPFTERVDEISWAAIHSEILPGNGGTSGFLLYLMGLVLAYSLFPREYEEGTIRFLHALPISRAGIFAAKFLAAWTILMAAVFCEQAAYWLLQLPNPEAMARSQFDLVTATQVGFLEVALATVALCHGMLLSFFRHYGLMIYALGLWGLSRLQAQQSGLEFLDPTGLVKMQYEGTGLILPWGQLAFQAAVAVFVVGLAYLLWSRSGQDFTRLYVRGAEAGFGRLSLGCATLVMVFVGLAFLVNSSPEESEEDAVYVSYQTAHLDTNHYRFTYPVSLRGRVLPLTHLDHPPQQTRMKSSIENSCRGNFF